MEESRYSWKQMPEGYTASYYNDKDYKDGKKFIIVDNRTGMEYTYPQIETRRNADGRVYDQRIIDRDLWNDEFMAWAVSTSKDFVNDLGKDWLNQRVLNYIVEHFEFPEIFGFNWNSKLRDVMTRDLWNKAFQRNKNVVRYVPKEYMTSEMINSLGELENLSLGNVKYEDLTPELFKKIYFNCDTKHKLNLLKAAPTYRTDRTNDDTTGVIALMTKEVADDILEINIRTIWNIPHKFITKEIANKAMDTDPLLMQYIPAEYQTTKYQKKAIDTKPEYLSLIDPNVVTDEMIFYALSKRGSVLGCVPKEKRTFEVCEYAISSYGGALRNTPDNVKNAELCFKAVIKDQSIIKYVPVEFLTQEFVDSLNKAGVVIPMRNREYVNECLTAHKKLKQQQLVFEEVVSATPKLEINLEYSSIRLESIAGLLTEASLKVLVEQNIVTVGDLLSVSDNNAFYGMVLNNPKATYKEIRGVIRLLKCKYLDIDPMITFEDTGDAYKDMRNFGKEIGFSTRVENILCRGGISPKKLYELMSDPNREYELYHIRTAGNIAVQEILLKMTILTEYYDNKEKKTSTATEDETIEALNEELTQVRAEIQRLNARTDEILAKIQEKMLEKNKGGVLK